MVVVEPVVHDLGINPEGERATLNQRLVVLRPVSDGVKRRAHDADLKGMVVIRSLRPQLVPFTPHRFGQQRHLGSVFSRSPIKAVISHLPHEHRDSLDLLCRHRAIGHIFGGAAINVLTWLTL